MSSNHTRFLSNPLQLGGIRTGTLDYPQPLGGQSCRTAFVETGGGLRFTIALDRGSDIIDAMYNDCPLAYLGHGDLMPPSQSHQIDQRWLRGWPGGLLTTCGPMNIGGSQDNDPLADGQHGRFSNLPAAVLGVSNPAINQPQMSITTQVNDTRMFGPCLSIKRIITCELGQNHIDIEDVVTNTANIPSPHHWLYHCNFGYPLLSPGSRIIASGNVTQRWGTLETTSDINACKQIPDILPEHGSKGEGGIIIKPDTNDGIAAVTILNASRGVAMSVSFDVISLQNLAIWQHFGLNCYVCGLEPFSGDLLHRTLSDKSDRWQLEPGESRSYHVRLTVHHTPDAIEQLIALDGIFQ
jgi:hypothetical protein